MFTRPSILICDQSNDIRELLKDFFVGRYNNALIVEAIDGAQADAKLANQFFDVAVIDLHVPKRSGVDILQSIPSLPAKVRPRFVIGLSSDVTDIVFVAEEVEKYIFISKPFTIEDFGRQFDQMTSSANSTSAAPTKPQPTNSKIDVDFINPFIEGTLHVLGTLANLKAEKESLHIRKGDTISGDVSAVISIIGKGRRGSMAIAFPSSTFLAIVSQMLGEKYTVVNSENADAAGEICNQIFGFAKTKLNEKGYDLQPALPSVVTGPSHSIKHMIDAPIIAVQFKTPAGAFTVEATAIPV